MAVLGIAQTLSVQNLCNKSGVPDWELKDDGEILLQQVDLEHGTRGACWVSFWKAPVNFEFECKVFKATVQGALLAGFCVCAAQHGSLTEK